MIDWLSSFDENQYVTTTKSTDRVNVNVRIIPAGGAARGGDWCESFALRDDLLALSIGDVCGHGPEMTEDMSALRQVIRDAARVSVDPAQTLAEANRFLRRHDPDGTATAIFAVLDTRRRTLSFANAGHPAPLMCGPSGAIYLEYTRNDVPLGVEDEWLPLVRTVTVPAASLLVLYTDGVNERRSDPLGEAAKLRAAALFAYQVPSFDTAAVIEKQMFLTGVNRDDAAILTAQMPAAHVPNERSPRAARRVLIPQVL